MTLPRLEGFHTHTPHTHTALRSCCSCFTCALPFSWHTDACSKNATPHLFLDKSVTFWSVACLFYLKFVFFCLLQCTGFTTDTQKKLKNIYNSFLSCFFKTVPPLPWRKLQACFEYSLCKTWCKMIQTHFCLVSCWFRAGEAALQ